MTPEEKFWDDLKRLQELAEVIKGSALDFKWSYVKELREMKTEIDHLETELEKCKGLNSEVHIENDALRFKVNMLEIKIANCKECLELRKITNEECTCSSDPHTAFCRSCRAGHAINAAAEIIRAALEDAMKEMK